ncbi:hypothetical protein P3T76_005929 [Phytophthora citrophthora]|uniref:Uncharacterized protein n=1 Tax=Phytophthora citrophthora TaxID=4793 RepID=A0AAD9GPK2_9STRA|nr:hypothetical protein P3T76_005929 [Phytophthora citrophthora]
MARFTAFVAATLLAISSTSAASLNDPAWSSQFSSKINTLPKATGGCSVCFYEQQNFRGAKFCVGKSEKRCTKVNPITAPGTIGSVKFGSGCDLVANVRVADVPYSQHVDVLSKDVANTGYNSSGDHSVIEVYVEEAGRACFLGIPKSGDGYGICLASDTPSVDGDYSSSITELMLFKSDAKDFDVIVYEGQDYNDPRKSPVALDVSKGTGALSYRFTEYSKDLEMGTTDSTTGMKNTLQNKVGSVQFVTSGIDATKGNPTKGDPTQVDSTPGSVAPAAFSA